MTENERRARDGELLLDLLQRTTKIEARSEALDAWQQKVDARLDRMEAGQGEQNRKLDTVISEITTAKQVARWGGGAVGWVVRMIQPASIGAAAAAAMHWFWPAR